MCYGRAAYLSKNPQGLTIALSKRINCALSTNTAITGHGTTQQLVMLTIQVPQAR